MMEAKISVVVTALVLLVLIFPAASFGFDNSPNNASKEKDMCYHVRVLKGTPDISAGSKTVTLGEQFTINVTINPMSWGIYTARYDLYFNNTVLRAESQNPGDFLSQDGAPTVVATNDINNTLGMVTYNETRIGSESGTTIPGVLASITFKAIENGTSNLNLGNVVLSDSNGISIDAVVNNGTVVVQLPTLFMISGFVAYSDGNPVLNPNVTITNLNTVEVFIADTNTSSNHYQVLTDSAHVSAGNILHFRASNGYSTEFNHTVIEAEINNGGFVQNITIPAPDLLVVEIPAQLVFANISNNISAVIKNNGTANAGSFNVSFDVNGTLINEKRIAGLGAGDTTNVSFIWTPSQTGNYNITVNADCDDDVDESNETNNVLSRVVTVLQTKPDLIINTINAYHYEGAKTGYAWFNLSNEVDVVIKNVGNKDAGAFNISLFADGEFIGKQEVSNLEAGSSATVQFKWIPIGEDCFSDCSFADTFKDFELEAIADGEKDVEELNETNNNLTTVKRACYNGYMADEPLGTVAHGTLHGGLLFTTGDGTYGGLYKPGDYRNTTYEITIPENATVVLARLNVYYTWHYEKDSCPAMEVSITNGTGTYVVPLDKRYNDIKCQCPGAPWVFPWGNYVFNITEYIQGSGIYTVTVKRAVFPPNPSFCIAAPGIEVLYEDETKPLIQYWVNEGADVLIGGRRGDGGHLSLAKCINNATFEGGEGGEGINLSKVKNATLGVVSPWAGAGWQPGHTNYLFFNGIELGRGVYHGYSDTYSETIGGISLHVGSTNSQVGMNVTDVTSYLNASINRVGQGDDGDNMMPCNAFLVVEYEEETPLTPFLIGWINDSTGAPVLNPNVTITNLNTTEFFIAETAASSNYYQVLTSSRNVSDGDVLHFYASNSNSTEFNHTVTQREINDGVFKQNLTIASEQPGTCGDVNNDGFVTTTDAVIVYKHCFYPEEYPLANEWAADVNCDGYITTTDAVIIYKHYFYPEEYPLECCSKIENRGENK